MRICDFDKMFTEGQSILCHLPRYFCNEHSSLWFIAKNFEADTAWTDDKSGLTDNKENTIKTFANLELRDIFEGGSDANPLPEIVRIFSALAPDSGAGFIEKIHKDLNGVFAGRFQGFRESAVKYHDLRHTRNVVLATIRLFHGLHCEGVTVPVDIMKLGLLCAYFHDTGMLLTVRDPEQTGAAYLKCHEERSAQFLRKYIHDHGLPAAYRDNCESIINCTNLTLEPEDIPFESEEIQLTGFVLGTADILAQMADRYYLECLPLLYLEQQDAGIHQHSSSISLMRQTTSFFHQIIERRLRRQFNDVYHSMQTHFREWWGLDTNLYMDFIEKNIWYLEKIIEKHDIAQEDLSIYLRRQQPKA